MKQKIFTLMILLALVVAGGKAFGQIDKYNTVVSSEWQYSITSLGTATSATLTVNQDDTDPTAAGSGTNYTIVTASSFSGGTATITLRWLVAGNYNLWVVATVGSCSNRAYRQVVVADNEFDVSILALGNAGIGESTLSGWAGASEETNAVCPQFSVDYIFDSEDVSYSDGSTYTFFRVDKIGDNDGTWNFYVTPDASVVAVEYWNGSAWVAAPLAASPLKDIDDGTTQFLIRVTVDNPAGYNDFDITVTATENYGTSGTLSDIGSGNNAADITISAMPDLGTVTFN